MLGDRRLAVGNVGEAAARRREISPRRGDIARRPPPPAVGTAAAGHGWPMTTGSGHATAAPPSGPAVDRLTVPPLSVTAPPPLLIDAAADM
jgi:hypothetical protein